MPTNVLWIVGLINAVIAGVSPVLASGNHGLLLAIVVIGAACSAIASYLGAKQVGKAVKAAAKKA